ncbi:MAG TPA: hypothetical protein P5193_12995 [Microthrixaceae bacterium]|nr:hypothetical protein [Microthrixaceae bacterium]
MSKLALASTPTVNGATPEVGVAVNDAVGGVFAPVVGGAQPATTSAVHAAAHATR